MFTRVWNSCHSSVCALNFLNERGVIVDSLTGFKVKNYLITSQHAFSIEKAYKVELTFVGQDANTITASLKIPYAEFTKEMRIGVFNKTGHYAVFNINLPEFDSIPSLELSDQRDFTIGSDVAVLAFSSCALNLSLRTGHISSTYSNGDGERFIQFDGQVCHGNSGAPLIDPKTLKVIGIVSRRDTPAAKSYKQLIEIITSNLNELNKVKQTVKFGDIDPFQVLIANQNQLKLLATNIYRYSVSSTSQAITLDRIISFFYENTNLRFDNQCIDEESDMFQV